MKTAIVIFAIIGYTLTAQGLPLRTSYCNGNKDNTTKCSACMNTGTQARQLASDACANVVANKITDCLWYNPVITSTKTVNDCIKCDGKDWYNITDNATAASIVLACSDTALVAATCATKVANCTQSFCHTSTSSVTTSGCRLCDSNYKGSGTLITNVGYASCATETIANCDIGHPLSNTHCYDCDSGYSVSNLGTTCVAFTTDSNCRSLGTGDAYCGSCDNGYIFNLAKCESSAKLLAAIGVAMAAFFFN